MEAANDSFEQKFQNLSKELDQLKVLYDQYFSGVLKALPHQEHSKWKASFASFLQLDLRSSAQKFKRSSLQSKHLSLQNLWNKTARQMEEGTFRQPSAKKKSTKSALSNSIVDKSLAKSIEGIYQKVLAHSEKMAKALPSKEDFQASVLMQMKKFRENNPHEKMEVYLKKTQDGEVRVSVRAKA